MITKGEMKMLIATFEKRGNGKKVMVEAFVEDAKVHLVVNGMKVNAKARKSAQHGWIYEVSSRELVKSLGGKGSLIAFTHESAKQAAYEVMKQQEEKKAAEMKLIDEMFQTLTDDVVVRLTWGTNFKSASVPQNKVSTHPFFTEAVATMEKVGWSSGDIEHVLGRKADEADYDDYSITHCFNMTLGELKKLVEIAKAEAKKKEQAQAQKEAERKVELEKKFEEAKQTGKKVEIRRWHEDCNNPNEDCDLDIVIEYAMPDGTTKIERHHTW
jgi:hypothetical protein